MGTPLFQIEGRLLQCKDGQTWEPHPTQGKCQSLSIMSYPDGPCQLHLNATSIQGGPTKILVDDLSSPGFRFTTIQKIFVQWTWKQEAYGLRCQGQEDAQNFGKVLQACREMPKKEEEEEKPLSKVTQFQPVRRTNSIKRVNSTSLSSSQSESSSSSVLKLMEQIRQENKREREEIKQKLNSIEAILQDLLSRNSRDGARTPTQQDWPSPPSMQSIPPCTAPSAAPPPPPTPASPSTSLLPPPPPPPPSAGPPPPPPPSTVGGGAAPPPPPPGPPPPPSAGPAGGSLADQLSAAKLKKNQDKSGGEGAPTPARAPKMDFSAELQNRIKKRSAMSGNEN